MAFDSAADLLFNIGANTDDAESNITRFRALLGTSLDDMGGQFQDWSDKVLGNLTTVTGAMTAGLAAIAAAVVAFGAYAAEANSKFEAMVDAATKVSRVSGISIEDASKLTFAAQELGVSNDALTKGLARLSLMVLQASDSNSKYQQTFGRLGISQAEVKAGQTDLLPLYYRTTDALRDMKEKGVEAAMGHEMLGRSSQQMQPMIKAGSAAIKEMGVEAEHMGLVFTAADQKIVAGAKAMKEAMDIQGEAMYAATARYTERFKTMKDLFWATLAKTLAEGGSWVANMSAIADEAAKVQKAKLAQHAGDMELQPIADPVKIKEATQDFEGLSNIIEQIRQKTAGTGDEVSKAVSEIIHLHVEADKAAQQFQKLQSEGKLTAESITKQSAALAAIPAALTAFAVAQAKEMVDKCNQAVLTAGEELQQKIDGQREKGYQAERAQWEDEITKLRDQMQKKGTLTAQNEALLEQLEQAGLKKRLDAQQEAWVAELKSLQGQLASKVSATLVGEDKIKFQYELDLQAFSEVEELKKLKVAASEQERAAISALYALNRKALLDKEKTDLQVLANSSGWQGVLGSSFGNLIKQDEASWKEWSQSANQALTMVGLQGEATSQMLQTGFGKFGDAMGQNIAQAVVYSTSIGAAMQNALASALESLAAQALVQAIFSTALGFQRLAQYDFAGAAAAFESAAYFGLIGGAAAVAGRAVAPPQTSSAGGGAAAGTAGYTAGVNVASSGTTPAPTGVQFNIYGPIIGPNGIDQLASMLTDAVASRDVKLVATQVRQATRATQ